MRDDLERWQAIEALVDSHFDQADSGTPHPDEPPPRGSEDAVEPVRQRVAEWIDTPDAFDPTAHPLAKHFGHLLDDAMDRHDPVSLRPGDEVGPYRIDGVIGEGGMGTVFSARRDDGSFHQEVALKLLHRSSGNASAHSRFLQERQILAGLKHPHIARLLDGGVVHDMPYLVMERIDGLPITAHCETFQLGLEERIRLLLQACDAIRYAHRQGVIHRDLKPSNILVEEGPQGDARVVVLDFGIALVEHAERDVTFTGEVFGTPGYMSPEQAAGRRRDIDRRSDIYSLGVLLYELLCGCRPFEGRDAHEILENIVLGEPVPLRQRLPGVPIDLETITMTCLEREAPRRYGSMRALGEDLSRYLDGSPIAARPLSWAGRWARRARQRPKTAALIAGALAVTLASLAMILVMAIRHTHDLQIERNAARAAQREAEGLLDFMLKDLHQGLDEVGRLDLLEQVARRSMDYYERRPQGGSPAELEGRARAYYNAGQILEDQGDVERALQAYRLQHQLLTELQDLDDDPNRLLQLARSHESMAGAYTSASDTVSALEQVGRALELSRRIEAQGLQVEGWADLHFDALALEGWLSREGRTAEAALAILDTAIRFAARRADLAETEHRTEEVHAWNHRRAVALSYAGLVHLQEGDFQAAFDFFEPAQQLCRVLVDLEPDNTVWREELQLVLGRAGGTLLDLGRLDAAITTLEQARHHAEYLVRQEPNNSNWLRELSVVYATLAASHQDSGDLPQALRSIEQSLNISRTLTQRFPDYDSGLNDLAWDLLDVGRIQRSLGNHGAAGEAWEEALETLNRLPDGGAGSPYYLDTKFQILVELKRLDEARNLARQLHGEGWKTPDFLALAESHDLLP